MSIDLDSAEASIVRERNPQRAVELLTQAAEFCRNSDRRLYLPQILLDRGRTYLAANDAERAWRDFAAGIDELESQRGAIANLELRSRMLNTAEDLFDEAIALQVRRNDANAAFQLAERARARALLDVVEKAPVANVSDVAKELDRDTALVEYAVLPESLVIFSIRDGAMRMHTVAVKVSESTPAEVLLGPVKDDIAAAKKIIFVPDKILQRVPFGQYLVQSHAVEIAPSASFLVARKIEKTKQRSVLIVGNPAPNPDENLEALPSVEREVDDVGAIYRPARVIFGPDATKQRFISEAPNYDVIHFAGHGVSDEESLTASLLFAKTKTDSGRMYMSDIAKLKLPRAPLVVLAACGTLRGKAAGVEGMPSLARSFLAAGASTVIGTLWDIDDAKSATLLASFHRHIVAGDSPAVALQSAQREAIARGGEDADPKNWAPFVVYTATP
ncbi:MAG TPA: CHAT domain-containing protein [Thermoanaerobaculia bacterium]|nr:CHAT domain-containing protein [Thermoanaerobaculia bacterium]